MNHSLQPPIWSPRGSHSLRQILHHQAQQLVNYLDLPVTTGQTTANLDVPNCGYTVLRAEKNPLNMSTSYLSLNKVQWLVYIRLWCPPNKQHHAVGLAWEAHKCLFTQSKSLVGNASCLVRDAADILFAHVCVAMNTHKYSVWLAVYACVYIVTYYVSTQGPLYVNCTENQFSIVNMKWWNVYANVISKLMGSHINKYWLRTSARCVRSSHSSGKVELQHPKSNQARWAKFCQVRDK